MRQLRSLTVKTISTLLALILIVLSAIAAVGYTSIPSYDGERMVEGLHAQVRIGRDAQAIPSIGATDLHDALMTLGFLHAQDRLWQMDMQRRIARGQVAALVGRSGLRIDRFIRTLGLPATADASWRSLSADAREALQAYADGVNAFVATRRRPLPLEFQLLWTDFKPWQPTDSILILKLMALGLSTNWRDELRDAALDSVLSSAQVADLLHANDDDTITITHLVMGAAMPQSRLDGSPPPIASVASASTDHDGRSNPWVLPGLDGTVTGLGSNVAVLGGARTERDRPLLASDPHLDLQTPGTWYLAKIETPDVALMGGTIPGIPLVIIGRNRDVAWGLTTTYADTQDLFLERVADTNARTYRTPTGEQAFEARDERIDVRFGDSETLKVRSTRHGPVLSDIVRMDLSADRVAALRWPALDPDDRTMEAGLQLMRAATIEEAIDSLRLFTAPVQNIALADRKGNIALVAAGHIPIRRQGDGSRPVDGSSGAYDWQGYIPFEALPHTLNPPSNLIVNANNRLVGTDYPYALTTSWPPDLRARRLISLLDRAEAMDAVRLRKVQLDQYSMLFDLLAPDLARIAPKDQRQHDILQALSSWNGMALLDRPEPLVFTAWYEAFALDLYGDELGPLVGPFGLMHPDAVVHILRDRRQWCDDVRTPAVETCDDIANRAFQQALERLTALSGPDWHVWRWGDLHHAFMPHRPMSEIPLLARFFDIDLPVGGDASSVNVASPAMTARGDFATQHMAGLRMIANLADETAGFAVATGQSGNPLSPHYRDLTEDWAAGRYTLLDLGDRLAPTFSLMILKP